MKNNNDSLHNLELDIHCLLFTVATLELFAGKFLNPYRGRLTRSFDDFELVSLDNCVSTGKHPLIYIGKLSKKFKYFVPNEINTVHNSTIHDLWAI